MLRRTIFGRIKANFINTYIGGVASTINTREILASILSIPLTRITSFSIVENNIQCSINGNYIIPSSAFRFNYEITYYIDLKGKCIGINTYGFSNCRIFRYGFFPGIINNGGANGSYAFRCEGNNIQRNLVILMPNAISIPISFFYAHNDYTLQYYAPKLLTIGPTVVDDLVLYRTSAATGLRLYTNPFLQTANAGAEEGDIAYFRNTRLATITYINNETPPNKISNFSITDAGYRNGAIANFSIPSSFNTIEFYEIIANHLPIFNVTASGQIFSGLIPGIVYKISIRAVDIYGNRAEISNEVNYTKPLLSFPNVSIVKIYNNAVEFNIESITAGLLTNNKSYYYLYNRESVLGTTVSNLSTIIANLVPNTLYNNLKLLLTDNNNTDIIKSNILPEVATTNSGQVTDLSNNGVYATAFQILFTPIANMSDIVYGFAGYQTRRNGVLTGGYCSNGSWLTGLLPNTEYTIVLYGRAGNLVQATPDSNIMTFTTPSASSLLTGMLFKYKFELNTLDSLGLTGISNSGGVLTTGKIRQCISLSGLPNIRMWIANFAPLVINTGSIAFWIKTITPNSGLRGLFVKNGVYGIYLQDSIIGLYSYAGSIGFKTSGINIADDNWHHVVYTFELGTANNKLYLDGSLILTETIGLNSTTAQISIGASNSIGGENVKADFDELMMWNRKLTDLEIAELYNSGTGIDL